jgi:hypothetical protein
VDVKSEESEQSRKTDWLSRIEKNVEKNVEKKGEEKQFFGFRGFLGRAKTLTVVVVQQAA